MRIQWNFATKLDARTTTTADALAQVTAAIAPDGVVPLSIFLEDTADSKGVARVLKAWPMLSDYTRRGRVISDLDPAWSTDERLLEPPQVGGIDLIIKQAIADGIPRRFPVTYANFIFGPVAGLDLCVPPTSPSLWPPYPLLPAAGVNPFVVLTSNWGATRRELWVAATVIQEAPATDVKKAAPLPATTRALLDRLGLPAKGKMRLLHDETPTEVSTQAAIDALEQAFLASFPATSLPHTLAKRDYTAKAGSIDEALRAAMKHLGFSAKTAHKFRLRTALHNVLQVDVDWTPIAGEIRAMAWWRNPRLVSGTKLPVSRDPAACEAHYQEECDHAVANIAHAVERWLRELVPLLESAGGPGESWYDPPLSFF